MVIMICKLFLYISNLFSFFCRFFIFRSDCNFYDVYPQVLTNVNTFVGFMWEKKN